MEEGDEGREEVEAGHALTERAALRPRAVVGWGAAAVVVAVIRNRLWASPNLAFFTLISERWGENPFGDSGLDGDYLLTNLLGPTVARALGQTAPHEYARLHLVLLVVGLSLVVVAMARRFGHAAAVALCGLLAVAPVTTVAMQWLGQPDAMTLPLALAVVIARRRWAAFAFAVLLGTSHAEQGVFIALAAAVVRAWVVDDRAERPPFDVLRDVAALVGGVAVGRGIVELYLRANDIVVTTPRTSFLDLGVSGFWDHHTSSRWLVYSLWGLLWFVVIGVAVMLRRDEHRADRRAWAVLGLAAAGALVPMLLTLDETRVYSLICAPLLVGAATLLPRLVADPPRGVVVGAVAVALLVPGMFTAGESYVAWDLPPGEFARFLLDGDHPGDDLTGWLMGPYGFEIPTADG